MDPTYRKFLTELEDNAEFSPDIVLVPANDGMLHAFRLDENTNTSDTEIGEELWAWIPGYLLYRDHDASWAGRLIDQNKKRFNMNQTVSLEFWGMNFGIQLLDLADPRPVI